MTAIHVLSARDLRNRAGDLLRDAGNGELSLITKHGKPAAMAVPFDRGLIEQGVHRRLAVRLFSQELVTLCQASKIAMMGIEQFLDMAADLGVTVVEYSPEDVESDVGLLS